MAATLATEPTADPLVTIRIPASEMYRAFRKGKSPEEFASWLRECTDWPDAEWLGNGRFRVISPSGEEYIVDLYEDDGKQCPCQAGRNGTHCWHVWWAKLRRYLGPRKLYATEELEAHRAGVAAYAEAYNRAIALTGVEPQWVPEDIRSPAEHREWTQTRRAS